MHHTLLFIARNKQKNWRIRDLTIFIDSSCDATWLFGYFIRKRDIIRSFLHKRKNPLKYFSVKKQYCILYTFNTLPGSSSASGRKNAHIFTVNAPRQGSLCPVFFLTLICESAVLHLISSGVGWFFVVVVAPSNKKRLKKKVKVPGVASCIYTGQFEFFCLKKRLMV